MVRMRQRLTCALLALAFASGCSSPSDQGSTCELEPALVIHFLDASTNEIVRTASAAVHGPITITMQAGQCPDGMWTVWSGPGMYEIYVQASGYRDWEKHLVLVGEKACGGPRAVAVYAYLTPR
jgi:hypothetical protein